MWLIFKICIVNLDLKLSFFFSIAQNVMTRKKALVSNNQKKAVPGKKGKRLGGVVKRAMKAAKGKGGGK